MRPTDRSSSVHAGRCATVMAGLLVLAISSTQAEQGRLPSTGTLVARTVDYVRTYQNEFQFLVADESSVQRVVVPAGPGGEPAQTRTLSGEMFITYLDVQRHWTVVRDVAYVDGIAIADRETLPAILRQGSVSSISSVASRVWAQNERYNIGNVRRNFNDPMLALLPLSRERRERFAFSRKAPDSPQSDTPLVTLTFRERERPTIVRDVNGRPVFANGEVVVDAGTGAVRKTRITFDHDGIDAVLTTDFMWEEKLRLWVPAVFAETYSRTRNGVAVDVTTCETRYSNYRRFQVTGRLLR